VRLTTRTPCIWQPGKHAAVEAAPGPPLWVGGVDVKVALYAIQLPPVLRPYFGLHPIRANLVGVVRTADGGEVQPTELVTPTLRVLPRGWTLALVCQELHEITGDRVDGISCANTLVDRRVAPPLEPFLHTEYVDNFVARSQEEAPARARAEQVRQALVDAGLPCHEVECTRGGETLGWSFAEDAPTVSASRRGAWRLKLALQGMADRGRATGDEVSVLIGHYTFRALVRRELLCAPNATYAFVQAHRHQRVRLWPSVVRRLDAAGDL